MAPNYTILFAPADAVGHVNACIGTAEQLRDRGHHVVFAIAANWKGKLAENGFREELYEVSEEGFEEGHGGAHLGEFLKSCAEALVMSPFKVHEKFQLGVHKMLLQQIKFADARLREIVADVRPDAIIVDHILHQPALMSSGIPWILSVSLSANVISSANTPPAFAGYSNNGDDKRQWEILADHIRTVYEEFRQEVSDWSQETGGQPIETNFPFFLNFSPFANIYMYPRELDYTSLQPNPPNFYQFDAFVRQAEKAVFEIPPNVGTGKGMLIYFSMGTIGCMELDMMRRLIGILSKSPNRFIVSKGPMGDELELADNMWGANDLPQLEVLKVVDLVITHGGNNTITEAFYFGKRVLVLPLLWDQLDNGQRIEETGHGFSLHPCKVAEGELLNAIETLLADNLLEERMISISKRIQASNSQARAADLIEKIVQTNTAK